MAWVCDLGAEDYQRPTRGYLDILLGFFTRFSYGMLNDFPAISAHKQCEVRRGNEAVRSSRQNTWPANIDHESLLNYGLMNETIACAFTQIQDFRCLFYLEGC
jgi:hypothetical protein